MRGLVILSLLSIAFAGCTAPEEQPDPLFGVCPQWLDGEPESGRLDAPGSTITTANASMSHVGSDLALDRYHVVFSDIETDGTMEVKAYADADGRALRFTDHRDPAVTRTPTFLAFDAASGTVEVDVYLTALTHGTAASPSDLRLEVTGVGNATGSMQVQVTPGYRVCGVVLSGA